jgi:amino acid transporter
MIFLRYGSGGFFPYGISGTLAGAATCFYGYVGFDTIATSGEEAQSPQRNIPLAIVMSLGLVFFAYCGVSSALTLMLPYYLQDATTPLPYAFHEAGWAWAGYIVSGGALFGLSTTLLGAMFPLPRVLYAMASDGLIFRWLAHIHPRYQTPFRATMVAGLLAGIMASLFELKNLVDMMSIGTLMAYTMVSIAVTILRYRPKCSLYGDYIAMSANKKLLEAVDEDSDSSGEEIVYCSNKNPVLPTDDPVPEKRDKSLGQVLLCPWNAGPGASDVSASVANILTFSANIASLILALILIHAEGNVLLPALIFLAFIVLCTFWTWLLPTDNQNLTFKVPLVPLLPNVSIFINLYLMLKLSPATWVRFAVWMTVGAGIYIFYGVSNSNEGKKQRF